VASSNEIPWSLRFNAALSGSHSKRDPTAAFYRRPGSFRILIGITREMSRASRRQFRADL
jgi:hypothetical protein